MAMVFLQTSISLSELGYKMEKSGRRSQGKNVWEENKGHHAGGTVTMYETTEENLSWAAKSQFGNRPVWELM